MKKKFLKESIRIIKRDNPDFSEEKLEEIAYGLEVLYLTIPKMLILSVLALVLGIFKDFICLMLVYSILRSTGFGFHAEKSSHCLIISIILFIGGGLVCRYIDIPFHIKISISLICLLCIIKYAPADTYKRPLINAKKRKRYKIATSITSLIYVILIVILKNSVVSIYLVMGLLELVLMIHPLIYRMFHLPYNNYKKYDVSYS